MKEYLKIPRQYRRGCSTKPVEEDDEEGEVDEVGPTSDNHAANTIGISKTISRIARSLMWTLL